MTYLDTHTAMWLFGGERHRFSAVGNERIRHDELLVSPAVVLELQLLHEIKRFKSTALRVVEVLSKDLGLRVCKLPFASIMESALDLVWTRDPFDRLIVAHARANDATLLTKDEHIRKHYRRAIW